MLLLFLFAGAVFAQPQAQPWLSEAEKQLQTWQASLDAWSQQSPAMADLEARQKEVFELKQKVERCINDLGDQVGALQERLTTLGEAEDSEAAELKERRKNLIKQKHALESELAVCRLLNLSLRDLQNEHKVLRNRLLSKTLMRRDKVV